jgi:hypothetical protein
LGSTLGADALIFGEISRLLHFSTPLYTETSLEGSLRMVEAASGNVLWSTRVKAAERGGALMKKGQVVDFLKDQVRSFNPQVKFLRICDIAVKRALKDLPNPPIDLASSPSSGAADEASDTLQLAVLPFEPKRNSKKWHEAARALRAYVTADLQEGPFDVLEIQHVDAALKQLGWNEAESMPSGLSMTELARALGADVLLRGRVTSWGRSYFVIESWVKAGALLELVDGQSGEVIWSEKKKNRRHAGFLKGPTSYKSIAVAPITGLKASNLDRVANHLSHSLIEDLNSSPAVLAYVSEPRKQDL